MDYYYEDSFQIDFPTGSGDQYSLWAVSQLLTDRMLSLWHADSNGKCPYAVHEPLSNVPGEPAYLFHEFYHADSGKGLGASHQTGWTALVAKMIQQSVQYHDRGR